MPCEECPHCAVQRKQRADAFNELYDALNLAIPLIDNPSSYSATKVICQETATKYKPLRYPPKKETA